MSTTRHRENQIIHCLLSSHATDGITTSEISTQLGIKQDTVRKIIKRLETENIPIIVKKQRYSINPQDYIRPLYLDDLTAWWLYLPLRRMVRSALYRHTGVRNLLHRLAATLNSTIADQIIPSSKEEDANASTTFQALVDAWRDCIFVKVYYQSPNNPGVTTIQIAPYWFEPAVWSDSIYVVGGVKTKRPSAQVSLITLKIDRILNVEKRTETFSRPDPKTILNEIEKTWGIWQSKEVQYVKLRFSNRVVMRVKETRWHPLERIFFDGDDMIWEAPIAEPKEMLPWIRGWGSDVIVEQPSDIRRLIELDVLAMVRLYELDNDADTHIDENFF